MHAVSAHSSFVTQTYRAALGFGLAAALGLAVHPLPAAADESTDWPMFGQNLSNTANQVGENKISPGNVGSLVVKWTYATMGDVSARAAVAGGVVYFPDWGGYLHAVRAGNGNPLWSKKLTDYGLPSPTNARSTPAVAKGVLYIGTQEGAWLLAIDAKTGNLIWRTQLESPANDPFAIITTSPVVVDGTILTGVASTEEGIAGFVPGYPCCKARGSVVAVDAATGQIKWKTYTTRVGYSGAGVWGSNPVVDVKSKTVFVGTGNNYAHPTDPAHVACIAAGGTAATCNAPDNYVDSILALDTETGKIKWTNKLVQWNEPPYTNGSDDWNVACLVGYPPGVGNCPSNAGPDYDFASAPNLITYQSPSGPKTILGAGQKSGIYYALDPQTGKVLWQSKVGPGSALGGMEWGSASDGNRIYVSIANFYGIPWGGGSAGFWAALDPATGAVLWKTADPNGAVDIGPMTVANGVVYASSMAGDRNAETMLALDAATGVKKWGFAGGTSVNAGATVVDGVVYWGSGYTHLGIPGYTGGNNLFYAFTRSRD
jgi:polyvinyl alcohol dehydrogenase (cytochrome)